MPNTLQIFAISLEERAFGAPFPIIDLNHTWYGRGISAPDIAGVSAETMIFSRKTALTDRGGSREDLSNGGISNEQLAIGFGGSAKQSPFQNHVMLGL
jgi:hypothetical protein